MNTAPCQLPLIYGAVEKHLLTYLFQFLTSVVIRATKTGCNPS